MKRALAIILALVMALAVFACTPSSAQPAQQSSAPAQSGEQTQPAAEQPSGSEQQAASTGSELAGSYDITIWCAEAAVDLMKQQVEAYNNSNEDGIKFNVTVEPVSEADAGTNMITDVEAGGDLFCFAQDQFARLVQAGALSKLGVKAGETVREANDAGVVAAATVGDELWAYPMTSDNGYFMYYDKSVIPEEDIDSLEKLIADCEAAGKYFAMETNTSAWYLASFFFATGCVSEWETDGEGKFVAVHDTFNSPEGLIAAKGLKKLQDSKYHLSSSKAAEFDSGAAIVVTGTWDFEAAKAILGDNLGVADLPSFEVDGVSYHMGSYNGCKLMGVKPQVDPAKSAAVHKLAQYLTGEECQMQRFETLSWGPSNKVDQASEAVQANPGLAALLAQAPYSIPQGQIHGSWWDIAKVIGDDVGAATDDAGLQAALDAYKAKIDGLFNMSEEEKNAWSVIGAICGTAWDTDFPMTDAGAGVFQSEALELHAGEEFKVRQGASWDVSFGDGGNNFVVPADGTYIVSFDSAAETITLVPAA